MSKIALEINFRPVPLRKRIYLARKFAMLAWDQFIGRHSIYWIHDCGNELSEAGKAAIAAKPEAGKGVES